MQEMNIGSAAAEYLWDNAGNEFLACARGGGCEDLGHSAETRTPSLRLGAGLRPRQRQTAVGGSGKYSK